MVDYGLCRLSLSGGETELAGPPVALRALVRRLRDSAEPVVVPVAGGFVAQEMTAGPLLVNLEGTTLRFSGRRGLLDIIWEALEGLAEQAENADDRGVNRHQHLEYYPGDEYQSADSIPLVIVADWPDEA